MWILHMFQPTEQWLQICSKKVWYCKIKLPRGVLWSCLGIIKVPALRFLALVEHQQTRHLKFVGFKRITDPQIRMHFSRCFRACENLQFLAAPMQVVFCIREDAHSSNICCKLSVSMLLLCIYEKSEITNSANWHNDKDAHWNDRGGFKQWLCNVRNE